MAILSRFLPYAGWPLAAIIFWFWLEGKENLAREIERCNTDKMAAVAEAEALARTALQASLEQRLAELERMAQDAQIARNIAEAARLEAEAGAEDAQATIRRLMREAGENETVSLEMACLNTTVPADAISGLR